MLLRSQSVGVEDMMKTLKSEIFASNSQHIYKHFTDFLHANVCMQINTNQPLKNPKETKPRHLLLAIASQLYRVMSIFLLEHQCNRFNHIDFFCMLIDLKLICLYIRTCLHVTHLKGKKCCCVYSWCCEPPFWFDVTCWNQARGDRSVFLSRNWVSVSLEN